MKFSTAAWILSGILFFGLAVSAQSTNPGPAGSSDNNHRMGMRHGWAGGHRGGHHLHYTPEQRQQMMTINMEYRKKSEELFDKDNSTLGEYKAGLIALQKEKKSKLEALLTPSQKEEIEKWKARRVENEQVRAAAHMEKLKLRLNLSDEQVAKLKSGQSGLRAQIQSIRENDNLLPQQKREQLKGLMAKREDALKSVLTPDQLTKFQEMQKSRSHRETRGFHSMEEEGR